MPEPASIFDNLSDFGPRTDDITRPHPAELDDLVKGSKFRSREGAEGRVQQRRRRTGRNVQFNIRATQAVIDEFKALSEHKDWPDGLTLEYALAALKRELLGREKLGT